VGRPPTNKLLARDAIITYYRRKARGSKVAFKEVAEFYGIDVGYARVVKVEYDKHRRRGGA